VRDLILNLIGFTCTFNLFLVLFFVLSGALQGNFRVVHDFFKEYPGSEPFMIFIFPVILIVGLAWLWQKIVGWKKT